MFIYKYITTTIPRINTSILIAEVDKKSLIRIFIQKWSHFTAKLKAVFDNLPNYIEIIDTGIQKKT